LGTGNWNSEVLGSPSIVPIFRRSVPLPFQSSSSL
jgi:hypothetical protein